MTSSRSEFLKQNLGVEKPQRTAKQMMADFKALWNPEKVETGVYTMKAYSENLEELKNNKLRLNQKYE